MGSAFIVGFLSHHTQFHQFLLAQVQRGSRHSLVLFHLLCILKGADFQ